MSTMQADYENSMLGLISRIGTLKEERGSIEPNSAYYIELSERIIQLERALGDVQYQNNLAREYYGWEVDE